MKLTEILENESIDLYEDANVLYSGPVGGPNNAGPILSPWEIQSHTVNNSYRGIGSESNFVPGNIGCIEQQYNLGEMTGDPELNNYGLTERYDYSGHDDFHLNQDIIDYTKTNNYGFPAIILNSGRSNKVNNSSFSDGFKGLGPAHNINLFEDD
ncbi:hypothetical protein D6777_00985 [Candidatus Woesearchaeota archaeon]|nr:MAG: hypothetical protein D6777_00985 [Candidatus Woesearchaeota archaeon]